MYLTFGDFDRGSGMVGVGMDGELDVTWTMNRIGWSRGGAVVLTEVDVEMNSLSTAGAVGRSRRDIRDRLGTERL